MRFLALVMLVGAVSACSPALPARWVEPATGMEFVLLPAGQFVAGSPTSETGHQDDEVLYPVRIAKPLYMGRHEVTQGEWAAVMTPGVLVDPAVAKLPVVDVTWGDARRFLDRLNADKAWRLRLPSETEWEYACRAGTTTAYATGQVLTTGQANFNGDFPGPGQPNGQNRGRVTPVESFPPNAFGLFDMHGNVWEWTNDGYDETRKVIRGGSWRFNADSARCAVRYHHRPEDRGDSLGFRIVRDVTREEADE